MTPDALLGRMTATMRFLVMGVMPVGSLAGGILATTFEPRTTLWVTAMIASVAFLPVLLSRVPQRESEGGPAPARGLDREASPSLASVADYPAV